MHITQYSQLRSIRYRIELHRPLFVNRAASVRPLVHIIFIVTLLFAFPVVVHFFVFTNLELDALAGDVLE